jgi:hypothetical protein
VPAVVRDLGVGVRRQRDSRRNRSDGNFAYSIDLGGPPGTTSEDKAKEIAGNLYDRVHGAAIAGST